RRVPALPVAGVVGDGTKASVAWFVRTKALVGFIGRNRVGTHLRIIPCDMASMQARSAIKTRTFPHARAERPLRQPAMDLRQPAPPILRDPLPGDLAVANQADRARRRPSPSVRRLRGIPRCVVLP